MDGQDEQDEAARLIEHRAYAKSYAAGRRRRRHDNRMQQRERERQAFLDKAFFAALPFCLVAEGWKFGKDPITSIDERVKFSWRIARIALGER